jgi:hypothetical protein
MRLDSGEPSGGTVPAYILDARLQKKFHPFGQLFVQLLYPTFRFDNLRRVITAPHALAQRGEQSDLFGPEHAQCSHARRSRRCRRY